MEKDLKTLKAFNGSDLVLVQPGAMAVGVRVDSLDNFILSAKAEGDFSGVVDGLAKSARKARIVDNPRLVRQLYRDFEMGETIHAKFADKLQGYWGPKEYVPAESSPRDMIALHDKGAGAYRIGFLTGLRDEGLVVQLATTSGPREYRREDVIGFPVRSSGSELLKLEPNLNFLEYAMLQVAKTLNSPDKSVYQQLAIRTQVDLNEGYIKQLSAYTPSKEISWLVVAMQNEVRGRAASRDGLVDLQISLEHLADKVDAEVRKQANGLGLPVVGRDRKTMLLLLEEQRMAGFAAPIDEAAREEAAMDAANRRGNTPIAGTNHRSSSQRGSSEATFGQKQRSRQRGSSEWGYNRSGEHVRGPWAADGYGHALGEYDARRNRGTGGSQYRNESSRDLNQHSSFENQNNTTGDSRFQRIDPVQIARRNASLSISDYGKLAHASHVLVIKVGEGTGKGAVKFEATLSDAYTGRELWTDYSDRLVYAPARAEKVHIASGKLLAINPKESVRPNKQVGLTYKIPKAEKKKMYPEWVVYKARSQNRKVMVRDLFAVSSRPLELDRLHLKDADEDEKSRTFVLDDDFSEVPFNNKLRCIVLALVDTIKPRAGSVVENQPDQKAATISLVSAERSWKRGDRLIASRPKKRSYSFGSSLQYDDLPFDLTVDSVQGSFVNVSYQGNGKETLWDDGWILKPGDIAYKRYEREPTVAIETPRYWKPGNKGFGSERPSDEVERKISRGLGWRKFSLKLQKAGEQFSESVRISLNRLGIKVTQGNAAKDVTHSEATHVVRFNFIPTGPSSALLKTQVFLREEGSQPILTIRPKVAIKQMIEWRP